MRVSRQGYSEMGWLTALVEDQQTIEDKLRDMAVRLGIDQDSTFIKRAAKRQASTLCRIPGCLRNVVKDGLCTKHLNNARQLYSTYGALYDFDLKFIEEVYVPMVEGVIQGEKLYGSGA